MGSTPSDCAIPPVSVTSHRTFHSVDNAQPMAHEWNTLHSHLDAPTSSPNWVLSCAESLKARSRFRLVVAYEDGAAIAFGALAQSAGILRPLTEPGRGAGEPFDFCYRDADAAVSLLDAFATERLPLDLDRVPIESPVVAGLKKAYRGKGLVMLRPRGSCPYIDCQGGEDHTLGSLSSRLRQDLRRAARRAARMGELSFEMHSPRTPEELAPLWDTALKVEAAGWKGHRDSALLRHATIRPLYESYARRTAEDGTLRVAFVKLDGQPIAMQIAVETANRFWLLKIGYNEQFSKCSPGQLLMEWTLRHAARKSLLSYEFLGAHAAWTDRWTKLQRHNVSVRVFPYSLGGIVMLIQFAFTTGLTRLWRSFG